MSVTIYKSAVTGRVDLGACVVAAIQARLAGGGVIAVDGLMGQGKTPFSSELAKALGIKPFEIDKMLQSEGIGGHVGHVDYDGLAAAIGQCPVCIVDPICVIDILEKLKIVPVVHIYVKRLPIGGGWGARHDFIEPMTMDGWSSEDVNKGLHAVTHEVMEYSYRRRPFETCDIEFSWEALVT